MRQGIDYPTAEAGTRIRSRYLRAMEEEQFDLLPDPSYVRGFLRAYASYLGLDAQLALDEYDSRFGEFAGGMSPDGLRRARRKTNGGPRRREAQLLWLAIGGVTGVALLAWLGLGGTSSTPATQPVPGIPTTTVTTSTTTGTTPDALDLTFTGRGNRGSYLEVRNGSDTGATVYSGVLVPGAARTFSFPEAAWVRIGTPAAIAVTIDGEPLQITGGTGTFLITRSGAERLPGG